MSEIGSDGSPSEEEAALLVALAFRQLTSGRRGLKALAKQDDTRWRFSRRWWHDSVALETKRIR